MFKWDFSEQSNGVQDKGHCISWCKSFKERFRVSVLRNLYLGSYWCIAGACIYDDKSIFVLKYLES